MTESIAAGIPPTAILPSEPIVGEIRAGPGGRAENEWRLYWPLLLVGLAGMMLSTMSIYTLGVMVAPLEQEFGWSRTQIFTGPLIFAIVGFFVAPVTGGFVDRVGPRKIGLVGVPLLCLAVAMLSQATAWPPSWWILWFFVSVATSICGPTVWAAGVNSRFIRNRGLALATILCGAALGGAVIPAFTEWLVEQVGWRQTYVVVAAVGMAVAFPLVVFLLRSPADRPVARTDGEGNAGSLRKVYFSLRFVMLLTAIVLFAFPVSAVIVNMVPILTGNGFGRAAAAQLAGLIGLGAIVGRLCGGFLLDRLRANYVTGACLMIPSITGVILLNFPHSPEAVSIALVVMGLSLGTEMDACGYLTAQYFGLRNFGKVFGVICGLLALSNGIAPMAASFVYDHTHNYMAVLWLIIPATIASGLIVFCLGRPPERTDAPEN
jgi:MFS family permease